MFSQPYHGAIMPEDYLSHLTTVQLLRAEGKTRRGCVEGRSVHFKRLSSGCKVNAIWETVWKATYITKDEAMRAAEVWEKSARVPPRGFLRENHH